VICPKEVLKQNGDGTPFLSEPEKCMLCSLCWRICPDFAIIKNPGMEGNEHASE
jgi:NAD-dependent dihydropyrimidine dehydrogenase PreA subunit